MTGKVMGQDEMQPTLKKNVNPWIPTTVSKCVGMNSIMSQDFCHRHAMPREWYNRLPKVPTVVTWGVD